MSNARNLANIISGGYAIPSGSLTNAVPAAGSITPAMLEAGAAVTNIGYTPANKAGDMFTGAVTVTGAVNVTGAIVATDNVTAYGSF